MCSEIILVVVKKFSDFLGIEKSTEYGQTISGISSYKSRGKGPKNTPLQKVYDTDDGTAEGKIGRRENQGVVWQVKTVQNKRKGLAKRDIKGR